jgi:hypothetical protein
MSMGTVVAVLACYVVIVISLLVLMAVVMG